VNWCKPMASFAYNTRAVKEAPTSYTDAWDPRYRDRVVLVSMRITQAIVPLLAATHHATKAPLAQCLPLWREGIARMKELRPNILQVSSNYAQAQQLNETGECDILLSPDSRSTLLRKTQGARSIRYFRVRDCLRCRPASHSYAAVQTRNSAGCSSTR